jgi:hypothetical protein
MLVALADPADGIACSVKFNDPAVVLQTIIVVMAFSPLLV